MSMSELCRTSSPALFSSVEKPVQFKFPGLLPTTLRYVPIYQYSIQICIVLFSFDFSIQLPMTRTFFNFPKLRSSYWESTVFISECFSHLSLFLFFFQIYGYVRGCQYCESCNSNESVSSLFHSNPYEHALPQRY